MAFELQTGRGDTGKRTTAKSQGTDNIQRVVNPWLSKSIFLTPSPHCMLLYKLENNPFYQLSFTIDSNNGHFLIWLFFFFPEILWKKNIWLYKMFDMLKFLGLNGLECGAQQTFRFIYKVGI